MSTRIPSLSKRHATPLLAPYDRYTRGYASTWASLLMGVVCTQAPLKVRAGVSRQCCSSNRSAQEVLCYRLGTGFNSWESLSATPTLRDSVWPLDNRASFPLIERRCDVEARLLIASQRLGAKRPLLRPGRGICTVRGLGGTDFALIHGGRDRCPVAADRGDRMGAILIIRMV
jgi:hypothetical protein